MTTFRSDVRDGIYGLLTGFQTANPTLIHHTYRRRPGSFPDKYTGYVGSMPESILHTGGSLSQRTMTPNVVLVMRMTEPSHEQADAMDDLVDAFITYANARPHAVSNQTVVVPTGVEDVELEAEGTFYPAAIVTFSTIALEGRT
jgi:hypothetical protein